MAEKEKYIGENRPYMAWTIIAVVIISALAYFVNNMSKSTLPKPQQAVESTPTISATISSTPKKEENMEGLKSEDLKVGTGSEAVSGKKVTVNYKGTLTDGTKFDSSYDRGTPFSFVLGSGVVIKGWDLGVSGMKVGGKRKLTIPPDLGYGSRGAGALIPPNATLVFEVELLKVE